jgi:hypothetical protein
MKALWISVAAGVLAISAAPKKTEPLEHAKPAFLEACARRCEQKHSMQAIAIQMIRAQCRDTCTAEWKLPIVETAAELKANDGKRVRLLGTISDKSPVEVILKDKTTATLELDPPSETKANARMVAIGTLAGARLTQVSAIVPVSF